MARWNGLFTLSFNCKLLKIMHIMTNIYWYMFDTSANCVDAKLDHLVYICTIHAARGAGFCGSPINKDHV